MHEVLVNRLGGLPRKSVVRLTDRPDMTLDVYRGRKTTMQQPCNELSKMIIGDINRSTQMHMKSIIRLYKNRLVGWVWV